MNVSRKTGQFWNILVIDDLPQLAGLVEKYVGLVAYNCQLRWAATLSEAEYEIRFRPPHLVLLDLHMPRDEWLPGPHMLREFGQLKPLAFCRRIVTDPKLAGAVVVLVSVDDQIAALSKAAGAHAFYNKYDFTIDVFERILQGISDKRST